MPILTQLSTSNVAHFKTFTHTRHRLILGRHYLYFLRMSELYINKFLTLLRHYRQQARISQSDMARVLGVSLRTYQRIENGESEPSLDLIAKSAEHLGFHLNELFGNSSGLSEEHQILLRAMRMLERALEISRVGAWELDVQQNKLYWNSITREIHEIEDQVIPTVETAIDFYKAGSDRDKIRQVVQSCIETGRPFNVQLKLITAKGNEITVHSQGAADFENGTCVRLYGSFQDITKLKSQQEALRQANATIQELQALAAHGQWDLDLQTGLLRLSDSLQKVFEIDCGEGTIHLENLLERVHPEDRPHVRKVLTSHNTVELTPKIRYRLLFPDGRVKWIVKSVKTELNDERAPLKKAGHAMEITHLAV